MVKGATLLVTDTMRSAEGIDKSAKNNENQFLGNWRPCEMGWFGVLRARERFRAFGREFPTAGSNQPSKNELRKVAQKRIEAVEIIVRRNIVRDAKSHLDQPRPRSASPSAQLVCVSAT